MNQAKIKQRFYASIGLLLISLCGWFLWSVLSFAWEKLSSVDSKLAVGLITASTTVVVAALTVSLGRYFERKKEIESHFRNKKIQIYDEFLQEFFKLFHQQDNSTSSDEQDLTLFLVEWQRKMILWGGSNVLASYIKWKNQLAKGEPNAQSMFLTDDFFKAIRKDLGLSNRGLEKGIFVHLILKNSELFLQMAKEQPNITLTELSEIEEELNLNTES